MASLIVTPEALAWIARRIVDEAIERPLISVAWAKGQADVRRDSSGAARWSVGPDEWLATIMDLAELERAGVEWPGSVVEMHGYKFSLLGKPQAPHLEGCALEVRDGKLVVNEIAI